MTDERILAGGGMAILITGTEGLGRIALETAQEIERMKLVHGHATGRPWDFEYDPGSLMPPLDQARAYFDQELRRGPEEGER